MLQYHLAVKMSPNHVFHTLLHPVDRFQFGRACTHALKCLTQTLWNVIRVQQMCRSVQILYKAFLCPSHNRNVAIMRNPAANPGRLQPLELHTESICVCM
jgi:hypothetical protein